MRLVFYSSLKTCFYKFAQHEGAFLRMLHLWLLPKNRHLPLFSMSQGLNHKLLGKGLQLENYLTHISQGITYAQND